MAILSRGGKEPAFLNNMIGLRMIHVQRHKPEERFLFQKHESEAVPMLTLKRKTRLVTFLIVLCQFAIVDTVNFLPLGIILYSMGIAVSMELLSEDSVIIVYDETIGLHTEWNHVDTIEENDDISSSRMSEEEELQTFFELAKFEHHVLKKRPRTKFVRVRQDGRWKLFAV